MQESRLSKKYKEDIIPALKKELGYKNDFAVPRLVKVVLNVGISSKMKDTNLLDVAVENLTKITGQKPVVTIAKKAISNFKIRKGMNVGAKVTLRGQRMYAFLDKLFNVTFPRRRDFRGISIKTIDNQGNVAIGFKDQSAFPEVGADGIDQLHGLEVMINTTAKNANEGMLLYKKLGFPFKDK